MFSSNLNDRHDIKSVRLKLKVHMNHLRISLNAHSDVVGQGWGLKICLSEKLAGEETCTLKTVSDSYVVVFFCLPLKSLKILMELSIVKFCYTYFSSVIYSHGEKRLWLHQIHIYL